MRYEPLQLGIGSAAVVPARKPDGKAAGVLFCPGSTVAHVTVAKAAVYVQFGLCRKGQGSSIGSVDWEAELLLFPVLASYPQPIDAVRVWRFSSEGEAPQVNVAVA